MSRGRHIFAAIMLVVAMTSAVPAQATQPIENAIRRQGTTQPAASESSGAGPVDTTHLVAALAGVLALIFILRLAAKRFVRPSRRSSSDLRVVGRTYLSSKQQVLLLQVGRRVLVVGTSGQQVSTLCEITDADEVAALLGHPERREVALREPETALTSTRQELNGLAHRVRMLASHLNRA